MGRFEIANVRPGSYSLYAWVDGFIGDYKYKRDIIITPGIFHLLAYNHVTCV